MYGRLCTYQIDEVEFYKDDDAYIGCCKICLNYNEYIHIGGVGTCNYYHKKGKSIWTQ